MITYKQRKGGIIRVLLEKRIAGEIRPIDAGFAYFPKDSYSKARGKTFFTIQEVKNSLEGE